MATDAQMDSLNRRHQELKAAIDSEIKHPAFDELRLVELKRQKLRIKDQLEQIRERSKPH